MDDIASSLGLYKVKVISSDTQTCLFTISPDMSSSQQAEVMLQAAQQLRDVLSQVGDVTALPSCENRSYGTPCYSKVHLLLPLLPELSGACRVQQRTVLKSLHGGSCARALPQVLLVSYFRHTVPLENTSRTHNTTAQPITLHAMLGHT
jgi:hypothetical protein